MDHPSHEHASQAIISLVTNRHRLCIIPQNLIEFWNVATRPTDQNGLGWSVVETDIEVGRLEVVFELLPDAVSIYGEWRRLVTANAVLGKNVHDARIVAAMKVHEVTKLLTFNTKDFQRFSDIILIDPVSLNGVNGTD